MATVVVDANVWISALFRSEGQHAASRAWVDRWQSAGNDFAVPNTFLVEVGCVISRKQKQPALASATVTDISADPSFRLLAIGPPLARRAANVGITAGLRGADALYAAVAQQLRIPIVTWDNELLAQASKVGVTARVPTR